MAKVLNDEDAGPQQTRVDGPTPRRRVIYVPEVDADEFNPTLDQSDRKIFC
jgi:hypothetical protein